MSLRQPKVSLAALTGFLVSHSPALPAQAIQSLYSPVIIVSAPLSTKTDPDARPIQMREDGSAQARINFKDAELSYLGGAGARYFLGLESDSTQALPDGSGYNDFVSRHENGDPSTRRVMTTDRSLGRHSVQWSADGRRVAYLGKRYASDGRTIESGAFVGDVEWVGGVPWRIFNERIVATDRPADRVTVNGVVLDAAADRIALNLQREVVDAQGRHVRWEAEGMYVATLPPMDSSGAEPLPTLVRIQVAAPSAERGIVAFSPVPGDDRLLYHERAIPTSPYETYLRTVEIPQQYDGSALTPTVVTSKSNSSAAYVRSAGWSPTGTFVAVCAARTTNWTESHVYKIAADGTGKAIRLTSRGDAYAGILWRP